MKESGRDYLTFLEHTMPKYMDNIFISAKIEGFNFQDSHQDSLKINHFEGVILLLCSYTWPGHCV